ncbi:hypothetical protein [Campylobacter rectus]|uniref:hypothetical protein n=1 Tax=Campylobacter rectus TaxID=203 RepID=UPI0028DCBA47|nr:hypothetical protein [Campylobacter rectus]
MRRENVLIIVQAKGSVLTATAPTRNKAQECAQRCGDMSKNTVKTMQITKRMSFASNILKFKGDRGQI